MNCKPGDLAIVVGDRPDTVGLIVEVVRIKRPVCPCCGAVEWFVRAANGISGGACDPQLRPIRDQPGADETLTWAPVPQKVSA